VSDSPELFELDSEEDDGIVTHRLRRAEKARRSARGETEGASSSETATADSEGGALAASDDDADSVFELDPDDDDILVRRRPKKPAAPPPPGYGRWFAAAIVVGVAAGVALGYLLLSSDKNEAEGPHATMAQTTQPSGMEILDQMDPELQALIDEQRAVVDKDPNNFDARMKLGSLLFTFGDLEGSYEQWTTAAELSPDRSEPWFNLGTQYYLSPQKHDLDAAQSALQKAVDLAAPGSSERANAEEALRLLDGASP